MYYCILAGGHSRRMGRDKAFLTFGDKYLIEVLAKRFDAKETPVCISSSHGGIKEKLIHLQDPPMEVRDCCPDAGPLGGIYTLLKTLGEDIFVVATDMPFADRRLAQCICSLGQGAKMAVMGREDGRLEMLFGYYSTGLTDIIGRMIARGNYRLRDLADLADCKIIEEQAVQRLYGPGYKKALFNMNTWEDYENALKIYKFH